MHDVLCRSKSTEAAIGRSSEWHRHAGLCVCFRCVEHRYAAERAILVKKHIAEVCPANVDRILEYGLKDWLQLT